MRPISRILFPVALLLVLSTLAAADGLKPVQRDDWEGVYVSGAKVGYGHTTVQTTVFEGKEVYRVERDATVFVNGRAVRSKGTGYIGADFLPVLELHEEPAMDSFSVSLSKEPRTKKTEIRYSSQAVECVIDRDGKVEKKSVPIPKDADLRAYCMYALDLKRPAPGEKLVMTTLDPDDLQFKKSTVYLQPRAKIDVKGTPVEATPMVEEDEDQTTTSWYLNDWTLVRQDSSLVVTIPESRDEAVSGLSTGPFPTQGPVKADKEILESVTGLDDLPRLTGLDLRLTGINDPKLAITDSRQTATFLPDQNAIDYHIVARPVDPAKISTLPIEGPAADTWLCASACVQSDDKQIVKLARKIVGGEKNAYKAACKLRAWVHDNITAQEESDTFFSALAVLKAKRGDCKHFALLYTGLARAAGIPARVVVGLVYSGDKQFAYHAWAECFVGEWVPMDATGPWDFVNAMYIKFAEVNGDDLKNAGSRILASKDAAAHIKAVHFDPPTAKQAPPKNRPSPDGLG